MDFPGDNMAVAGIAIEFGGTRALINEKDYHQG